MRADVGVAILAAAVGLLAAIAVTGAAIDSLAWRLAAALLAVAGGLGLAHLSQRAMLRIEPLRGWVGLVERHSQRLRVGAAASRSLSTQ